MKKRIRSKKSSILFDAADPSTLISCGVDIPSKYLPFGDLSISKNELEYEKKAPPKKIGYEPKVLPPIVIKDIRNPKSSPYDAAGLPKTG